MHVSVISDINLYLKLKLHMDCIYPETHTGRLTSIINTEDKYGYVQRIISWAIYKKEKKKASFIFHPSGNPSL